MTIAADGFWVGLAVFVGVVFGFALVCVAVGVGEGVGLIEFGLVADSVTDEETAGDPVVDEPRW